MTASKIIKTVRGIYATEDFIPLHEPSFNGNEKRYLLDTIDSTFVSSVGRYVDEFEQKIESYTGCEKAVAVVNGTSALHVALHCAGVKNGDFVLTQALTFVATCNAISLLGAKPIFIDVSSVSMGLCPKALAIYLDEHAFLDDNNVCRLKSTSGRIKAALPMHTFGHPVELDELMAVCDFWGIELVEDAAESLGSFYKGVHTGVTSSFSALSFNGNKIITTGGGGMVMCNTKDRGKRVKHLTTTAKQPHPYEYYHDEIGFNYRLPNLNSALGCAQMEALPSYLKAKRKLAQLYREELNSSCYSFVEEPDYAMSNYWLNAVLCETKTARDALLKETNDMGVMTRPVWQLMHRLPMYKDCLRGGPLVESEKLEATLVNLPSTPPKAYLAECN
ncbi:LegC family aminotransferase [Marinagarivorans algicola]|uniref:LegC family aminotransferase n=1 Tax=Marinagarivorans algicola TaxID=1513270 RepID=UPI0006B61463|nr:LegC family aminotransferase [Marinagarivorans algicola]